MEITATDRAAIRSVIESQMDAFQKDDATGAFAFASLGIQQQFGTPENFMHMVTTSYQAVHRPRSVLFEEMTTISGALAQPVLLLDADGVPVKALYLMEFDSTWKINGCYIVPIEGQII